MTLDNDPTGTGVVGAISDDGLTVTIGVKAYDGTPVTINCSPEKVGDIAAYMLMLAVGAFRKTGKKPTFHSAGQLFEAPAAVATAVGLAESQNPETGVLVVRFGEAELGIVLHISMLQGLGEALAAASAQGKAN